MQVTARINNSIKHGLVKRIDAALGFLILWSDEAKPVWIPWRSADKLTIH